MPKQNFFKFEKPEIDFPFYNGHPVLISLPKALFLVFMLAAGFILFSLNENGALLGSALQPFINIAFPLLGLAVVAGSHWKLLFRKIMPKDLWVILSSLLMCMFAGALVVVITSQFFHTSPNPVGEVIEKNTPFEDCLFLLKSIPMLIGEELLTLIPFLLILQFAVNVLHWDRKQAIILAWILSAIFFGAIHIKTYQGNLVQAILGIGFIRLFLTYPYVKTKNLWISTIVHIINDWLLFLPIFILKYLEKV